MFNFCFLTLINSFLYSFFFFFDFFLQSELPLILRTQQFTTSSTPVLSVSFKSARIAPRTAHFGGKPKIGQRFLTRI
jgi:hypothetical protein